MVRSIQKTSIKIKHAFKILSSGNLRLFFRELKDRWNSQTLSLGLQRDLQFPVEVPEAKIPLTVRRLKATDIDHLMGFGQLKKENFRLYEYQMSAIDDFAPNCFVAENIHGEACYMQFLIGAQFNEKIQLHFNGIFPLLSTEEALLEGPYLNPQYRGLKIVPAAMARIAEKARKMGARWVITFVDKEDTYLLKSCAQAGFKPYILRVDRWFMFRMTTHFEPLNDIIIEEYEHNMGIDSLSQTSEPKTPHRGILVNGTVQH